MRVVELTKSKVSEMPIIDSWDTNIAMKIQPDSHTLITLSILSLICWGFPSFYIFHVLVFQWIFFCLAIFSVFHSSVGQIFFCRRSLQTLKLKSLMFLQKRKWWGNIYVAFSVLSLRERNKLSSWGLALDQVLEKGVHYLRSELCSVYPRKGSDN